MGHNIVEMASEILEEDRMRARMCTWGTRILVEIKRRSNSEKRSWMFLLSRGEMALTGACQPITTEEGPWTGCLWSWKYKEMVKKGKHDIHD